MNEARRLPIGAVTIFLVGASRYLGYACDEEGFIDQLSVLLTELAEIATGLVHEGSPEFGALAWLLESARGGGTSSR